MNEVRTSVNERSFDLNPNLVIIKVGKWVQRLKLLLRYPLLYPKFVLFERSINLNTWRNQRVTVSELTLGEIERDIAQKNEPRNLDSLPSIREVDVLRRRLRVEYGNKYENNVDIRILLHVPPSWQSPGGYSLFNNLLESLGFIGVKCEAIPWDKPFGDCLANFKPTLLLTSDHQSYLSRIDWRAVAKYRRSNGLKLGLTASLQEYGNTPLKGRLSWAKKNGVDFYYSFRSKKYIRNRKEYEPFFENGYEILSVEFGANPMIYYPIPWIKRDLSFVFLASSNPDKWRRYFEYMPGILKKYEGIIDGPGWPRVNTWLPPHLHKYVYARAKVGLNLHILDSIEYPSELNERTYILAACGVPQLVDNAMLLAERFDLKNLFVGRHPKEYEELFGYIMENPDVAQEKALGAMKEVYEKHTTIHRADRLITDLIAIMQK